MPAPPRSNRLGRWVCFLVLGVAPIPAADEPVPAADNPAPVYPEPARYGLVTGDVWFRARVLEDGSVESVQITRVPTSNMRFEDAVRSVVMKWRFQPATRGPIPIAAWFEGSVRFSLKPADEEAIRGLAERGVLAWNRGSDQVLASLFSSTAHVHTATQPAASGPFQIRQRFEQLLGGALRDTRLVFSVDRIRFYAPDRAEVEQTFQLTGQLQANGRVASTVTKEGGEWLIQHARLVGPVSRLWDTEPAIREKPPDPEIPEEARANDVSGRVTLAILVLLDGSTEVVDIVEGLGHGCDDAAVANARLWRWSPARRNGLPVEASGVIELDFAVKP